MARALIAAALVACALGAAASPASAILFPSESIDGPSPDILRAADVDVARDGGGAVVYLKRTVGQPHVWVARMVDGGWGGVEQLDVGQVGESTDPHVAVADGGRAVASWVNAGRLWSSIRTSRDGPWTGPVLVHDGGVQRQSLDLSLHGVGYAAYSVGGASRDVRVARLAGTTWTELPGALDNEGPRDAGGGNGPVVAAAADGTALAAWEEVGADGRRRVFERRALREELSAVVREASLPELEGHAAGDARNPDVGMDDDSSYGWIALEQAFDDGGVQRTRVFGRPLIGVEPEPAVLFDGQQFGSGVGATNVDIDVTGRERALAVSETLPGAGTLATVLQQNAFGFIGQIDTAASASSSDPAVGQAVNGEGVYAWHEDPGTAPAGTIGRFWNRDDVLEPETQLANGEFGPSVPSAGLDVSSDRLNDTAIAFVQGPPLERRLVVAHQDRAPRGTQASTRTQDWQANRRPRLSWGKVNELWGSPTYRVELFDQQFPTPSSTFDLPFDLPDGSHVWRVVTIDRRGQEGFGVDRRLNIDTTPPIALLATTGKLKKGQSIRFVARDDPQPVLPPAVPASRTSGLAKMTVSFGDGGRLIATREARHVYRRKGNYKVRIAVIDRAGNSQVVKLTLKVKNK
jgi:PKD domain-containing protein